MADYVSRDAEGFHDHQAASIGGASSANQIPQLDNNGLVPASMIPSSPSVSFPIQQSGVASVDLPAGCLVNLFDSAGALAAQPADAASGLKADGFVEVGGLEGDNVLVTLGDAINDQLAGLAPGQDLFLGNSGAVSPAPAVGSGTLSQEVGKALSPTSMLFRLGDRVFN